jgi:aryl-alcohol dehydrogenase-like predicted oxidoreductase
MTAIPRRILGRTGVEITVLGYGAFELRGQSHPGEREVTSDQASLILNELLDSGINYIDTSPDYGWSETLDEFVVGEGQEVRARLQSVWKNEQIESFGSVASKLVGP